MDTNGIMSNSFRSHPSGIHTLNTFLWQYLMNYVMHNFLSSLRILVIRNERNVCIYLCTKFSFSYDHQFYSYLFRSKTAS